MSNKVIVSFSIPARVKEMLEELAEKTYSTNTKYIVDMIRRDYKYWFDKKEQVENWINSKENKEGIGRIKKQDKKYDEKTQYLKEENNNE